MKRFLLLLLIAAALQAHHGFALFDTKTVVTVQGTVTDFHFVNPHSVVEFEVKDAEGKVQAWTVELSSAGRLASKGLTAASLEAGDKVTVSGYRAKNGAPALWGTKFVLPNGRTLDLLGER
jgi:hypothetical protein